MHIMLKSRLLNTNTFVRYASQEGKKRFMRTVPVPSKRSPAADFGRLNRQIPADLPRPDITSRTWAKHSLGSPLAQTQSQQPKKETPRWSKHSIEASGDAPQQEEITLLAPVRRSRTSRFRGARSGNQETSSSTTAVSADSGSSEPLDSTSKTLHTQAAGIAAELPKITIEPAVTPGVEKMLNSAEKSAETPVKAKKPRRQLKPRKALITLSSSALENLRGLLDQPEPQLIRIGVQNRGCSGLTYHLEYVSKPGKFDEIVEQDGVTVVIDSKALFSIVGSEMDWIDDKLSSRFIFKNPNSKGTCGCGESFMV